MDDLVPTTVNPESGGVFCHFQKMLGNTESGLRRSGVKTQQPGGRKRSAALLAVNEDTLPFGGSFTFEF